jgi:Tol biopolymer transport system component/DNA-binding winged helix-turn-helix (wHTH) protein
VSLELTNTFKVGEFVADRNLNKLTKRDHLFNDEAVPGEPALLEPIIVEPKVMEVLYYMASRPDHVITRQELMNNLWQSQVSDGAVSRVIGLLRKALGDNSEAPAYIQTVAKKGYQLIAEVKPITETVETSASKSNNLKLEMAFLLFGVLLTIGVLVDWVSKKNQPAPGLIINQPQFTQLTSESGFEYDANLSQDEKWLVYRHRENAKKPHNLFLKRLDSQQTIQLTSSDKDDRAPTFSPDKHQLVFTRKALNYCRLVILTLDDNGLPLEEKEVYQCGAFDHYSNVTWSKDGASIYFTDRASAEVPYQIHKLSLATGRVEKITSGLNNYYGDNELALSPSGNYLAFFRNKYWGNNQVYILDLQTGEERKLIELGFLAWNISWTADETHLLYSDNRNGGMLKLISVADGSVQTIYYSPQSINSPELSVSGSSIIYSTETADVDLWKVAIDSNTGVSTKQKLVASSSRVDRQPVASSDGTKLLFLSDRNGQTQLWLQDESSLSVMDSINNESRIDQYSWHPNGELAVVALSNKRVYLLDTTKNTNELVNLTDKKAAFPQFSNDGNTLYFTSDSSGDWQIWSYQLANGELKQLTLTGGYRAKPAKQTSNLFFTKYQQPGLWSFNVETQVEKKINIESERSSNFYVCSDSIIYEQDNKDTVIMSYNFNTQQKRQLMSVPDNARIKFDLVNDCQNIIYSVWENIESDVMMLRLSEK